MSTTNTEEKIIKALQKVARKPQKLSTIAVLAGLDTQVEMVGPALKAASENLQKMGKVEMSYDFESMDYLLVLKESPEDILKSMGF